MSTLNIDLGPEANEPELREQLQRKIRSTAEALVERQITLYGQLEDDTVWLGVTRPNRFRIAQRLFRGRLERDGGRLLLRGAMKLPLNGFFRLLMLIFLATATVALLQARADTNPAFYAIPAALLLICYGVYQASQISGRRDFELIREKLEED